MGAAEMFPRRVPRRDWSRAAAAREPGGAEPSPCGFTLVELLVVVAIIGTLIALLLPAVQAARESGRRAACSNNIRQLALGVLGYLEANGSFPPAGKDAPLNRTEWSWAYQTLPFIDGQAVFDQPLTPAGDVVIHRTPIPSMYCPTRRPATLYNSTARADYAGCMGTQYTFDSWWTLEDWFRRHNGLIIRTGVGPVRPAHVLDGLSNTLLLGEKQLNPQDFVRPNDQNEAYAIAGWDSEVLATGTSTEDFHTFRYGPPAPDARHPTILTNNPFAGSWRFGSSHQSACVTAFADGSIRWVRFDCDAVVFQRVCNRSDLQVLELDAL